MESRRLSKIEQKFTCAALICVNFFQLPLIDILYHEIKPADLFNKISTCPNLANGKKLQPRQQRICFLMPPKKPEYNKFDVTLLYTLLRNVCSSLTPQQDWGKEPKAIDILIVHDIERLKSLRNEIAHTVSSEFTDDKFEQFWNKVESVIQRIQNFTSNLGCKTNYMQRLKEIKTIEFGYDDVEKYKFCLESILRADQPEILIKGDKEIEVLCGDKACFELEIKQADLTHWTVTWQKISGSRIEQINTSTTRYSDSTDRQLVIHSVCKEDKGNYRAVLSEKVSNGKSAIQVVSNVISLHTPGEPPFSPKLKVTNGREDIFVHYKCEVPERSPRIRMLQWTKNGLKLTMNEKYTGGDLDDDCLTIKSPTTNDRGIYCCTVSNAVGSGSQEVKLDVPNATIFKETIVYCGSSTKLSAEVSSCPSPDEVKWQRSSDGNSFNFIDIDEPEYFGSTNDIQSPLLRIPKATSDVQLYYRLYLRNKLGENISNTIYLNITGSAPNITVSHDVCFQNNSVKLIGKVYLLSGKLPAIQDVFWTKDGKNVDIQGSGGKYCKVGVDDPSLIIYNVNHRDIGTYQLTATNAVGSMNSDVVVLGKPQIVLERTERNEDGTYWFTMTIKAIPEPTEIQWSMKENNEKAFELLNINDDEYKGTTDAFPHPVLVVKSSKFEKHKFQIEVKNFIGNSAFIIQGEKHPKVQKADNNIHDFGIFYIDGGASVRFSDLSNEIAENFPKEKINQLIDIIQDSCTIEDTTSLEQAVTPRDILRILKNNKLFTPSDVICMQYLLKRTDCKDLYTKCIKYAEEQDVLCFYEKPLENGFRGAEFHVRGNLSDYSKEQIEKIIETVSSIVGCFPKEIHVNGYRNSSSFFVVLSMKGLFTRKLLSMKQEEKDNLFQLNIDNIIVDNDIIYLEHSQDNSAIENSTILNIIRSEDDFGKNIHLHILDNSQSEEKRKTIEQTPGCEKNDHDGGKDNHQEVIHTAYRCHVCGKFPVSPCISCMFNVCKKCKVQHPCTPTNANAALSHDEKGNQRSSKNANLQDIPSIKCAENLKTSDDKCPGKPFATEIKSDYVSIFWNKSNLPVNHYQVRFKAKNGNSKWKFTNTDSDENNVNISGLMANTKYTFQVRGIFGDEEGPYSPANEDIETKMSSATALLKYAVLQSNTKCPSMYSLSVKENKNARNISARTKQVTLGTPMTDFCGDEKTIMLVGATGSGKSTLVDGIVNYIMGVSFDDPFRFTMVTLEKEEQKLQNQAISQTEWITVYKIYPTESSRLSYTLNIIDTPGFGDTRGIERDYAIADQIRHLFSAKGEQGVLFIDAVCFIVKAPDARLTVVQKYIFSSIMSLFGRDIESNICTLITFADGTEPPVLASLKESELPFGLTFNFNNSALFADNKDLTHSPFSPIFWKMGCSSFEKFFTHIKHLETRSLSQTKNVLEEREQLKIVISNIRPKVTAGLSKLSELQEHVDIFKRYKNEINDNQNFEYEVNETRQEMIDLPRGQHVTNCMHCNVTCHENCAIADDEAKQRCLAMDKTGCCRICLEKCIWSNHKNTPYIFKYVTETVKKTYAEMKERYEEAQGKTLTHEKYIEELNNDVDELFELIMTMMNEMNDCKTRLKEIALRPDPLTAVEHIDLMIQSEKLEKQPGFFKRVQLLEEMKKLALVDQDVKSFGQNRHVLKEKIMSATGKSFQSNITIKKKNNGNAFTRGFKTMCTNVKKAAKQFF